MIWGSVALSTDVDCSSGSFWCLCLSLQLVSVGYTESDNDLEWHFTVPFFFFVHEKLLLNNCPRLVTHLWVHAENLKGLVLTVWITYRNNLIPSLAIIRWREFHHGLLSFGVFLMHSYCFFYCNQIQMKQV